MILKEIESKLKELRNLPRGWDGYSGMPITDSIAYDCLRLAKILIRSGCSVSALIPGADGSVQMEAVLNGHEIEIDILPERINEPRK